MARNEVATGCWSNIMCCQRIVCACGQCLHAVQGYTVVDCPPPPHTHTRSDVHTHSLTHSSDSPPPRPQPQHSPSLSRHAGPTQTAKSALKPCSNLIQTLTSGTRQMARLEATTVCRQQTGRFVRWSSSKHSTSTLCRCSLFVSHTFCLD
jgi:hypothetical protein